PLPGLRLLFRLLEGRVPRLRLFFELRERGLAGLRLVGRHPAVEEEQEGDAPEGAAEHVEHPHADEAGRLVVRPHVVALACWSFKVVGTLRVPLLPHANRGGVCAPCQRHTECAYSFATSGVPPFCPL